MAKSSYISPIGVLLGTTETTIYTTPVNTEAMVIVRFNNVDNITRKLNAFVYISGAGSDTNKILPLDFELRPHQQLELSPLYLKANYKITATSDVASKINAVPMGIETTTS